MDVRVVAANWSGLAAIFLMIVTGAVHADCEVPVGKFASITGSVDVQPSGGGVWAAAKLESRLCEGDTIRVGERSRAAVSLINNAVLRIDQNTAMRLIDITPQDEEQSLLDLFTGAFQSFSRKPKFLKVNTPYLNGSVEGTEFVFRVDDDEATITVLEGMVLASNNQGELRIAPGESAQASKGQAPQKRVVVKPRDLVQWGLYYPPVLATAGLTAASPAISEAANCAANGNNACAFAALDKVPQTQRDAQYLLLRSTVLLSAGRVDEARAEIDAALQKDANSGAAYALRSVIAVALNDNAAALADARRAVELSPQSAAATIALSYALQSNLQLGAARSALLELVGRQPDDALAWARLAELHLMLGDRREASAAAERAVVLQPGLARTQSVLGFTALAAIDTAQAQAAFEQAIALDSADPLPRLGLGLAKILKGRLEEGRADLEAAVALDSNNALLRAYLGKAYFEERRGPLDATQFEVAKELDPLDPTAFFYNAIRLQSENQPVEALRELEASIARNDNRAVYRSRLLLDQDRAARGTSQARVYNDLGFRQLGVNSAVESLTIDPSNASAHRFLADVYLGTRRNDIGRVSEQLQSQMLQDTGLNPVQPSLSVTNLNITTLGGPTGTGFNEFTPLFRQNGATGNVSVLGGNNDTKAAEAVASGSFGKFSLNAGAFTYETDGWRENNDLDEEIFNLNAQWFISPTLNLQAEYRHRDSEEGDLAFNFDPDAYNPTKSTDREQETWRLGLRYSPSNRSDLLLSYINNDRDQDGTRTIALNPFVDERTDDDLDESGDQFEAQYIHRNEDFNLVGGFAYTDADVDLASAITLILFNGATFPGPSSAEKYDRTSKKAYLYTNLFPHPEVELTLGLSYDDYDDEAFVEEDSLNPKVGLRWKTNENVVVRAAAFKTLKPALIDNRTLEPTQVSGFNQYFDDVNATEAWRYGVGVDWRIDSSLAVGAEATWRDLDVPVRTVGVSWEDRDEELHRVYLNWLPTSELSVSAELNYDLFENEKGTLTAGGIPERVRTVSLPVTANYFHPSGFFGSLGATYVDQEVDRIATSSLQGDDDFWLVDAAIGYRLPKRRGLLSLGVKNLFDTEFNYQDDSYREATVEASTGPYFPERLIMGTVTLSF